MGDGVGAGDGDDRDPEERVGAEQVEQSDAKWDGYHDTKDMTTNHCHSYRIISSVLQSFSIDLSYPDMISAASRCISALVHFCVMMAVWPKSSSSLVFLNTCRVGADVSHENARFTLLNYIIYAPRQNLLPVRDL